MRNLTLAVAAVVALAALFVGGIFAIEEGVYAPAGGPSEQPALIPDAALSTVNTTRIGSDDPVQTAVAVAQMVYPATEEENVPGAVVLAPLDSLPDAMLAVSRVSHFPVNAPLLYTGRNSLPDPTRNELLRLKPEGVPMDGNAQVYVVGSIAGGVVDQVRDLGFEVRELRAGDPLALSGVLDDWSSTMHGDHRDPVAVVNLDRAVTGIPSAFFNAHMGDGLVFVTNDGIPEVTRQILARRAGGAYLYLFGDDTIISDATAAELAAYGQVTRIAGGDPTAISVTFAGYRDSGANWGAWIWQAPRDFGWGNSDPGRNAIFINPDGPAGWANAICATTLSHMGKHAPALIVDTDRVPTVVADYLRLIRPSPSHPGQQLTDHGLIIGGERTISWEVQTRLDAHLDAYLPPPSTTETTR